MVGIAEIGSDRESDGSAPRHQFEYQAEQAAGYDARRVDDPKWSAEQAAFETLLDLAAAGPARVLDVPVGTGRFLPTYAERGHEVVGLDLSADMLDEARTKADGLADASIELAVGDITWLGLPDDDVDVAVCIRLLNLVDAPLVRRALAELVRVARSHVIVGIRTYDHRAAPRQFARRGRARVTGRPGKLTIHPERHVRAWFDEVGAEVVAEQLVAVGPHRSSDYRFFLLDVRG